MPEQLLGRIIRACSNEGDVVLDPFGGSGTTFAVAKKLSRRFIGFELSLDYAGKIKERLSSIQAGDPLVGPENAAMSAPSTKAGRKLNRSAASALKVSQSPVVARANVSLGQVAVANGEFGTAVAEAFMAAHQGYSADRVVADPVLNDRFLDSCRLLGIPGTPRDWNHLLLNVRKRGGLAAVDTSRRTTILRAQMDAFIFASEIAWRKVSRERGCALDDILCDPDLASEFDSLARRIAPGHSPFEYRWAALAVRKDASKGNPILRDAGEELACWTLQRSSRNRLPLGPGHYLIRIGETRFFAGFTDALRDCSLFKSDHFAAAIDVMGQKVRSERDFRIESCSFDFAAIRQAHPNSRAVAWRAARRAKLLREFEPIANIPLPDARSTRKCAA